MSPSLPASAYKALGIPQSTVKILTTPKPEEPSIVAPNLLNAKSPEERLAPNESSITLYAEFLLHIRTVTLFASLRTVHTCETKAKLNTDGSSVTVTHEGESATIHLPISVQGGGDAALSLPAQPPSKELTLRLQIEEKEGSGLLGTVLSEERKANIVPWDGATLNNMSDAGVHCKSCERILVASGQIKEWIDLPNENWAEMMDFWHCHKPDEHHLHDHTHEGVVGRKGYAAGNRLEATQEVGFVDLASFLLKEQDCEGVRLASENESPPTILGCKHCSHVVGTPDEPSEGWRIWKWCIGVQNRSYSIQKWISARLLFLVENQVIRKFHVHPSPSVSDTNPVPSLLIWVFTPDLFVSSSIPSEGGRQDPTRSMKVFYKRQTWAPLKPGEVETVDVEDVVFPTGLFEEFVRVLGRSRMVLPEGARRFQGWEVGLLERFDVGDVELSSGVVDGLRAEEVD
ncbi:hypothetical protein K458DRAFT_307079 [Lentithecium fluviatile CBS 122367]|uniref:Ubiquitin-conjugating enzyme E2-binding protein n=1 Tax=Lentithecium fluviatile CBS 122367 TaxID=1168545 RepID=A0A6G1IWE8_9PLEO|nr:hypothetical protein K458DRAFT_307079 [Lentithecium fluviatile CBS 122367]